MALTNRRLLIVTALVALAILWSRFGVDRLREDMSHFEATADGGFRYVATADAAGFNAPDDPLAEEERLAWLAAWLAEAEMCAEGYRIDARRLAERDASAFGTVWDVAYEGACTDP